MKNTIKIKIPKKKSVNRNMKIKVLNEKCVK